MVTSANDESLDPRGVVFDIIFAVLLTFATAFWGDPTAPKSPDDYVVSIIISFGMVMPLALRRIAPMLMVGLMSAATLAQLILLDYPLLSYLALPIAAYSVARAVEGNHSRVILIVGALTSFIGPYIWLSQAYPLDTAAGLVEYLLPVTLLGLSWVVIPYLLGRRDRQDEATQRQRVRIARELHEAELAQHQQRMDAVEANTRNEIARELHDVVAHSLSVIIIQADAGKAVARKEPEAAIEVLDTISTAGREALTEMRRIVGVLRQGSHEDGFAPAPGLDNIEELVSNAGDRFSLIVTGERPDVSDVTGLTVYRVVQEALTNVIKHADPQARAVVYLDYEPDQIRIRVINDGVHKPRVRTDADVDEASYGLKGMRERVTSLGGKICAQPTRQGGWVVDGYLPYTHQPAGDTRD